MLCACPDCRKCAGGLWREKGYVDENERAAQYPRSGELQTFVRGSERRAAEVGQGNRYPADCFAERSPESGKASELLDTIGANFLDSLACKGLNPNRVIVTSVTRTKEDVKRLRRTNGNASMNSCHFYGTTFDISWKRFEKVEDPDGRPMQDVSADTLKLVLSEVLRDLRKADRCYVKYELKQGCFHITAR